jgi:hypothetical protein
MMTKPNGLGAFLTRLLITVATPTAIAGYFCFVRDWAQSLTDQVPAAFFRLDLTSMFPLALTGVAAFAVLIPAYLGSIARTARADSPGPRDWGDAYRMFVSVAVGTLIYGTIEVCDAPAGVGVVGSILSSILIYVWSSSHAIMPWIRARIAANGYTDRLHAVPLLGRFVRPFRGRRKLVDTRLADPVARLTLVQVLGISSLLAVTGIGLVVGHMDAQTTQFELVLVPAPEVVLRHYNDEIVTAPINLTTETITTRYTKRRLTTDREAISIYHVHYLKPLQGFVPDESLKHLFLAAQAHAKPAHPRMGRNRLASLARP